MADDLRQRLREVLGEMQLPTQGGELRNLTIYDGWIPPKRRGQTDDNEYPFIMVRPGRGEHLREGGRNGQGGAAGQSSNTVDVSIYVGTFGDDATGYREALQVIERIMIDLNHRPQVGDRCRVMPGMSWEMPEEQPYPQWIAMLNITMQLPHTAEKMETDFYGSGYE